MNEKISSVKVIKFVEENQKKFYRMAFSYMKNEADALDIVHDTAVKILQNCERVKKPEYFETWAYRILINECLMALRKQKKQVVVADIEETDGISNMPQSKEAMEKQIEYMDLYHALDQLPPKLKTVVLLRFFEDMKLNTIAEITGDNLNTVKARLYKALKLMKLDLEVTDEDK